jgi:hypothetical protein
MSARTLSNLSLAAAALLLAACASSVPLPGPAEPAAYGPFSHEPWDRFLKKHVGEDGFVDYAGAAADPADLASYLLSVSEASPDSHPARFPSQADQLGYWLNAYNAWVVATVLEYYPIASVRDVPSPPAVVPGEARFFLGQRVDIGGRRISLLRLEQGIILRRFDDPRLHFALVSATRGAPRLSRDAYIPGLLNTQLDAAAYRFVAEDRNVYVAGSEELQLSQIFRWYRRNFTRWLDERDEGPATLHAYVSRYAEGPKAEALARCIDCPVQTIQFDWRLNAE